MVKSRVVLAVLCAIANAHAQSICPGTTVAAPTVVTAMASPASPESELLTVLPDCTVKMTTLDSSGTLSFPVLVDRVASIPSKTTLVFFVGAPLSGGFDLRAATGTVREVSFSNSGTTAFGKSAFPRSLLKLSIVGSQLDTLDKIALPSDMISLSVVMAQMTTLTKVPPSLQTLDLGTNKLKAIDFDVPDTLTTFSMNGNPIATLKQSHIPPRLATFSCKSCKITTITGIKWPATLAELELSGNPIATLDASVVLPAQLQKFNCETCSFTSIRGVQWPNSLTQLKLGGAQIKEFEVRASDFGILERVSVASFDSLFLKSSCSDSSAERKRVGRFTVCVISDTRFQKLYVDKSETSGGSQGGDSLSRSSSSSGSTPGTKSSSTSSSQQTDSQNSGENGNDSSGGTGAVGSTDKPGASASDDPSSSVNSTSSSTSTIKTLVVVVCGCLLTALVVIGVFWVLAKRRRQHEKPESEFTAMRTSTNASNASGSGAETRFDGHRKFIVNDVRRNPSLSHFRIDRSLITMGLPIARGGFGIIYKATYNNTTVAMKQLTPEAWRDNAKLSGFMDEILLCATLNHPKIVQFIGMTWSNLRDLSVVIEFMDGGDLYTLLQRQAGISSTDDWFEPWTDTKTINSKSLIAQDITEAVAYLHAFDPPILHRDLKSRNVLVDSRGNAKLSDFGISREMAVNETMTGEVGTLAWIAPEVLRGDRYSEKADIYSLGVLLVELDRCQHPYTDDAVVRESTTDEVSGFPFKSTHIAVLVGSGQLIPTPSRECPPSVRDLISRCVQSDANDRPSAHQVLQILADIAIDRFQLR